MTSSKKLSSRDHKTDIQMNSLERGSISQTFPGPCQMEVSALRERSGHGAPFLTKKLSATALAKGNQFFPNDISLTIYILKQTNPGPGICGQHKNELNGIFVNFSFCIVCVFCYVFFFTCLFGFLFL